MRAGATLAPISDVRTLRHMGLGEPLKHTLAAEPGSWVPGLPLSPQPGVSVVLTQSSPSCPHVLPGEGTGEHRKAVQDTVGWSWSGEVPTVQGGMVSVWLLRQGRRRSAGAGLGSGPLPAIPPGRWSMMGNPGQRPGLSARGSNPASVFARCVIWGRRRGT